MAEVPRVTETLLLGTDQLTIIQALRSDPTPEAMDFTRLYQSLSDDEKCHLSLEEIFTAADIDSKRFIEIVCGALWQQGQDVSRMLIAVAVPKVTKATIEAATTPIPIFTKQGELVGYGPPDLKAQEMFHKIAGTLPLPKGAQTIINMQQLNQGEKSTETNNLQPMDDFLMELKDIKQKRLESPKKTLDSPKTYEFQEI